MASDADIDDLIAYLGTLKYAWKYARKSPRIGRKARLPVSLPRFAKPVT